MEYDGHLSRLREVLGEVIVLAADLATAPHNAEGDWTHEAHALGLALQASTAVWSEQITRLQIVKHHEISWRPVEKGEI